jgi:hypothetical protein
MRAVCMQCMSRAPNDKERADRNAAARQYYDKHREVLAARRKHQRRNNVARAILHDARKADRKRGLTPAIDLEFVEMMIKQPCSYCGDQELRPTLDRIDNKKGHTKDNVVSSCERCNYIRRDMPYPAWLVVAKGIRSARLEGLLGSWTGGIHRRFPLGVMPEIPREPRTVKHVSHGTLAGYKKCGPPTCGPCKAAMAAWKATRRQEQELSGS